MSRRRRGPLFGPELTSLLLPTRRPFLMVDHVLAFTLDPQVTIHTRRLISINEPIFDGHFPDLPMWPGAYTIEAFAQSAHLLFALRALAGTIDGPDPAKTLLDLLSRASAALRMQTTDPQAVEEVQRLAQLQGFGLLTGVDLRLEAPVFAGDSLELTLTLGQGFADHHQVECEGVVGGKAVARGVLRVAQRPAPHLPPIR